MNGNLTIQSGGNLTFNNVTLKMNNSEIGEYKIESESGANVTLYNSNFSTLDRGYSINIDGSNFYADNVFFNSTFESVGNNFLFIKTTNGIILNSQIRGGGYYGAAFEYGTIYVENTTFEGGSHGFSLKYMNKITYFKNCTWSGFYLGSPLLCENCNFLWYGTFRSSLYSKNHNGLTNQTYILGDWSYTSDLNEEYKTEANRTIVFKESSSTATIDSGVAVTFDNVTLNAGTIFLNTNSLTVNGTLFINRTNLTVLDINLINPSNVITSGTYLFQKWYLDVKAIYQGVTQEGINITGYDKDNNFIFTNSTGSNGLTDRQELNEFLVNDSGITYFNLYTLNSSEIDGVNRSETTNLTSSKIITIPHDYCDFTSNGWLINDENKYCENRTINISSGDVTIQSGYSLTLYNSTLVFSYASARQDVIIGNNASFIVNKSTIYSSSAYIKFITGSPNSTINYKDSFSGYKVVYNIYINENLTIQNSTIGKVAGYEYIYSIPSCRFNVYTDTTQYRSALINHSNLFHMICFNSDNYVNGSAHLTLLDTGYIPNVNFNYDKYFSTENCSMIVNNTLDLKVLDDDLNAVSNTAVNITDENGNSVYNGTTDAEGYVRNIPLTYRIFNNSGNFLKNYTVLANSNYFNFEMGMPRREYSNRTLVVGTYNQNYEEKLSRVPYLYDFGFTITDDTDTYDYRIGNATYQGFYNAGFLTSVSSWAIGVDSGIASRKGFVDNESQRNWLLDLQNKGFELALHSASEISDTREQTINAFNNWSLYFGFPMMYWEHSQNGEHLISGTGADSSSPIYLLDLVNTSNVSYYWNLDYIEDNAKYKNARENSSTWYNGWKAYGESIDPITGERWSNGETSLFPNNTNPKALLPTTNKYGDTINLTSMIGKIHIRDNAQMTTTGLLPLYTPTHIFDLVETKDLTILYTHSTSFSQYSVTLTELAKYDGWFVPAGNILNYSSKLERVAITGGDKTFTVTNNGEYEIEGVVVYPDTNGTIINILYANTTAGNYLLSIGLDKDEMMLPSLASGESLTVTYDIMGAYNSSIPKISNISNSNVELRNAIYNSTAKKTEFKVGLDRITTYNSTNTSLRWTNITVENLDSSKTYTILRDDSAWTNHSWDSDNTTLYVWTFLSEHNFTIQEEQSDGASCSYAESCLGGYCVHNICRSTSTYCGDDYCDTGETCSSCSGDCGTCTEETPTSGSSATYNLSSEQLEEGYSKLLRKTQKVQFTINEQTHTAVINSVNVINKKVKVEIEGEGIFVELSEGSVGKIDLDNDGYYDLQISVKEVRINGYADLEFKEIHEEVPAGEKEEQESPSKIEEKIKSWMWIVGGVISILIIGMVVRQLLKKKSDYF